MALLSFPIRFRNLRRVRLYTNGPIVTRVVRYDDDYDGDRRSGDEGSAQSEANPQNDPPQVGLNAAEYRGAPHESAKTRQGH